VKAAKTTGKDLTRNQWRVIKAPQPSKAEGHYPPSLMPMQAESTGSVAVKSATIFEERAMSTVL